MKVIRSPASLSLLHFINKHADIGPERSWKLSSNWWITKRQNDQIKCEIVKNSFLLSRIGIQLNHDHVLFVELEREWRNGVKYIKQTRKINYNYLNNRWRCLVVNYLPKETYCHFESGINSKDDGQSVVEAMLGSPVVEAMLGSPVVEAMLGSPVVEAMLGSPAVFPKISSWTSNGLVVNSRPNGPAYIIVVRGERNSEKNSFLIFSICNRVSRTDKSVCEWLIRRPGGRKWGRGGRKSGRDGRKSGPWDQSLTKVNLLFNFAAFNEQYHVIKCFRIESGHAFRFNFLKYISRLFARLTDPYERRRILINR